MSFSQGFNVNNNSVYLSTQKIQEFSDKPIWNANTVQDIPIAPTGFSVGQTIVYTLVSGTGVFVPGTAGGNPGGITGSVQFNNGNGGFTGDSNLIYSPTGSFGGLSIGTNQTYKVNNQDVLFVDLINNSLILGPSGPYINQGATGSIFVGPQSGSNNTTGSLNTFIGYVSGFNNTSGVNNTYVGVGAGLFNTIGYNNTCIGNFSGGGFTDVSGAENVFIGVSAGSECNGNQNVNIGNGSGSAVSNGNKNTFIGHQAGQNNLTDNNTCIGYNTGLNVTNQSGVVCIGINSGGTAAGNSSTPVVDGLYFPPALANMGSTGANVYYDTNSGQMGPVTSSLRFKENITDIEVDTTNIYNLRPVSYNYKNSTYRDFGLIAEEVNTFYPEIVPKDAEGPYSVNYDRITVLLLSEIKKLKEQVNTSQLKIQENTLRIQQLEAKN
jgi:hypothetical protein